MHFQNDSMITNEVPWFNNEVRVDIDDGDKSVDSNGSVANKIATKRRCCGQICFLYRYTKNVLFDVAVWGMGGMYNLIVFISSNY